MGDPAGVGRVLSNGVRIFLRAAHALLMLLGLVVVSGCNQAAKPPEAKKAVEVIATTPISDEVTDYQDFTGRLDAQKTVEIRARVSGFVITAPFKEGDIVHEGDLLFQIDRRTYDASFNQAEANVKQAIAERNLLEKNTLRARKMIDGRSLSQEEYDTMAAGLEKSKATVGSMEAARDMAKLYVDFTKVVAPLTGRVSRRLVDPGNLVTADNTVLTSIVADGTLYAYFDVDERTYLDLIDAASPGATSLRTELKFPVLMRMANEENFSRTGSINFVDNHVNANSGTIRMRAVFENPNGTLKPGLFVRIRLPIGNPYKAVLIPDEALMSDQDRKYVYVVNEKNEITYRAVEPGQEIQRLRVIKRNLKLGERVVISGMQRVKQNSVVEVKLKDPPKAPGSQLGLSPNSNRGEVPTVPENGKKEEKETKKRSAETAPAGH